MRLLRFIPIQLTLILILGIVLGHSFDFGATLPIVLSTIILVIFAFLFYLDVHRKSYGFALVGALLTLSIGVLSVSLSKPEHIPDHYSNYHSNGSHTWKLKITETLKPTAFSRRYIAAVHTLDQKRATGRILVNFPPDSLGNLLQIDDELVIYSPIDEIRGPLNPHQFDYKSYLNNFGVTHQLRTEGAIIRLENPSRTIYGRAAALRKHIIAKLEMAQFGTAELSIIKALLLGQRDDISETTYSSYKNAGAVHILAVSGLHIGILLLLLQFLFKPLERFSRGKTIKLVLIVTLLWGFAFLAGFTASVVRAVTMFSFVAYALYLNRPSNTFNILALSMFFILLVIDPNLLFQVGFQMSYAAVFAIVWIYPLLQKLWFPKNLIVRKIWQLLSVSVAAQLGVLPISLFYFHQFPGLFFISNLIIVPVLGIILGGGILVVFLALVNQLPDWLVTIYDTLIYSMNATITWVAQQEAFVFKNISFDGVQLVLAYSILIALMLLFTKPTFKKALLAGVAILGFQSYRSYKVFKTQQTDRLIVLHQIRNSVLMHQAGDRLFVFAQDTSRIQRLTTDYRVAEHCTSVDNELLQNSYHWQEHKLLRIDSLGVVPKQTKTVDYLLLTQSPKLNFERLLDSINPKFIIADGSNYTSDVLRWKASCTKRKLPFHYTGEKGAYVFR